jgi:hypothetical protein
MTLDKRAALSLPISSAASPAIMPTSSQPTNAANIQASALTGPGNRAMPEDGTWGP